MRRMKFGLPRIVLLAAALAMLTHCAGLRETTIPSRAELRLAPTERLLVDCGAPDAPMEVVTNDSPAGDAFLRAKALPIDVNDPSLKRLIARMSASVHTEKGVGIAAPQVGVSRRVILVQRLDREPGTPFNIYLNPVVTDFSDETAVEWEGCLSVPAGHAKVRRPKAIVVEYDTETGAHESERGEGFTARIFQHEIDHLDGRLFIDLMEPGPLMPGDEYREMRRREKAAREAAEKKIDETMKEVAPPGR